MNKTALCSILALAAIPALLSLAPMPLPAPVTRATLFLVDCLIMLVILMLLANVR